MDRGEEQWANPRWAVDLSTGEAAEIGLTVYVEEKMGSRPAPVLAQTEKELYLVEEQRTEHRTLPGLQGAPEDRMFTTQVCCLAPRFALGDRLKTAAGPMFRPWRRPCPRR